MDTRRCMGQVPVLPSVVLVPGPLQPQGCVLEGIANGLGEDHSFTAFHQPSQTPLFEAKLATSCCEVPKYRHVSFKQAAPGPRGYTTDRQSCSAHPMEVLDKPFEGVAFQKAPKT